LEGLTFKLVLADVDGRRGGDDVGDEVVDHLEVRIVSIGKKSSIAGVYL
jgi:hypothetical protein